MRSVLKIVLFAMALSLTNCAATHSSDSTRGQASSAEMQLAGYPVLRWHKASSWGPTIRFPGAIFQDDKARYWIGNGIGMHSYDEKRDVWTNLPMETLKMRVADIKQIAETNDHSLWIRSTHVLTDNIRVLEGEHWRSLPRFSNSHVSAMFAGRTGTLWFAAGAELVAYDGKSWSPALKLSDVIKRPQHSYVNVSTGLEDRDGFVWVATLGSVISFDPVTKILKNQLEDESLAHVQCMCEDNAGNIWFGSSDGSVSVYKRDENALFSYDLFNYFPSSHQPTEGLGLPGIGVNGILQDKTGQIMFATTRGLLTVDQTGNKWRAFTRDNSPLPEGSVTAIMQDREGRIWIGTAEGVMILANGRLPG